MRISAIIAVVLLCATSACGGDDPETASAPPSSSPSATGSPSAQTQASSAAEAFIGLADGGADEVPWSDTVTYSIAGATVATFSPDMPVSDALAGCPRGATEVEGRTCPVSPLKTVADAKNAAVVETSLPDTVGCNIFTSPQAPGSTTPVVVRPAEADRNCVDDFAVSLFVDAAGRVSWIDLTLSSP